MIKIVSLLLALFLTAPVFAQQSQNLKPAINSLLESLNQLTAIKKSPVDHPEKETIELEARKTTFNKILDLLVSELEELTKSLEQVDTTEEPFRSLSAKYLINLQENKDYYEQLRKSINRNIDTEELIRTAKEFQVWRESNYEKQRALVIDLIMVFRSQKMLNLAQNRLQSITEDFPKIEVLFLEKNKGGWFSKAKIKTSALKDLLADSETRLITAADSLKEAEKLLIKPQDHERIDLIIKDTVNNIAKAYDNFLQMRSLIK